MAFRLPPEITVSKKRRSNEWVYTFRHRELGELGRMRLQEVGGGQTHISCEVVGDPADPMTATRQALLEPVTRALTRELEQQMGRPGRAAPPPPSPEEPRTMVPSKVLQCLRCKAPVAMLIFADDARTPDRLEDVARMMYPQVAKLKVPTWVIGPPVGGGPLAEAPAQILRMWPSREPVRRLRPDEFNPELDRLQETHCTGRPKKR